MKAFVLDKTETGQIGRICEVEESSLADGDVTIDVTFSSMNYKDALAITGKSPVVRQFPMVPGIDCVGSVSASTNPAFPVGTAVVLNGWGHGEARWGGYAEKVRTKGDWLVVLPDAITHRQAMEIGTAGYTAMLCVMALARLGVMPGGEVLVTGASGGVGSIAVALLAKRGYRVVAMTGRPAEATYLQSLGAAEIMDRKDYEVAGKPLAKERWAGVVDSAGGPILANACAATSYGGVVAACGLAQSMQFPATVAPFILRGVTLVGIDSVYAPLSLRQEAWRLLAEELEPSALENIAHEVGFSELGDCARDLLDGCVRGRLIVKV